MRHATLPSAGLALMLGAAVPGAARAADLAGLPAFRGRVDGFTLTPRGEIDGLVLADGTEVKTPPHLSDAVAAAVRRGDPVTVLGLKAAALPLVQALSISDEATGRTVRDDGPGRSAPAREDARAVPAVARRLQARIRLVLHGMRGEVNGALLGDGTVLRLPPPDAVRLSDLLAPGRLVVVDGLSRSWSLGTVLDISAIGAAADRMNPVGPAAHGMEPPR